MTVKMFYCFLLSFVLISVYLAKISNGKEINENIEDLQRKAIPFDYYSDINERSIDDADYKDQSKVEDLITNVKQLQKQLEAQRVETKKCNRYRGTEKQKFETRLVEMRKTCTQSCPEKDFYKSLTQLSTGRYYFGKQRMSWFAAEYFCHTNGMELVSIESARENNVIIKHLVTSGMMQNSGNGIWISGNDMKKEGRWVWTSTSTSKVFDFTSWLPKEPNNHADNQHCAAYGRQGPKIGWDDFYCDEKISFICEVPKICETKLTKA